MCDHLERELNSLTVPSRGIILNASVLENLEARDISDRSDQITALEVKLKSYGLDELRISVLIYKTVYEWSLAEIAKELSIPSRSTAYYLFSTAKQWLLERGYGIDE